MILAGDIGGTNTRLALFARRDGRLQPGRRQDYRNDDHAGLAAILERFLADEQIAAACFGVAGLIVDGVCHLTNRDWTIDERALSKQLAAPARLINDVAAIASGVAYLPLESFAVLQQGTRQFGQGSIAVVAAGTGLGEAAAVFDGGRHRPLPSEGGHADFAPVDPIEFELASFLHQRHGGHVSAERVISGPGLCEIGEFLVQSGNAARDPSLEALPLAERPARLLALAQQDHPLGRATIDIFLRALAREAGNAALRYLALGGVVLAGGIPPRLIDRMRRPEFLEVLTQKGRFAPVLMTLPIRVALDAEVALLGAAMAVPTTAVPG